MPINPNISLGFKPADPFTTIGSMLNIANAQQQYQQAQQLNPLQVQAAQEQLRQALAINPQLLSKATTEARVAEATAPSQISTAASQSRGAESAAELAGINTANARINGIASRLTGLINNPLILASEQNPGAIDPAKLSDTLKKYGQEQARALGISPEKADELIAPYIEQAEINPSGIRRFLMDKLLATLDQGARATQLQPSGVAISTGAGGQVTQTNMFGPAPGQPIPGTQYEAQLPPTQPVVNPETGQTTVIGPLSQRQPGQVITGVGPQQERVLTGAGNVAAQDWVDTANAAKAAPGRIAIFQNIKRLAPDAFTGPTAERRQWVASLAQTMGIPVAVLESSSTDELAKNTNLLALAGGNTDAAREIAKLANPNTKMTKEGILRVTDQLIGIEQMNLARGNYLSPFSNNAAEYSRKLQEFNDVADPRLFQEMSREEFGRVWGAMSEKERAEIKRKQQKARQLGIL